MGIDRNRIADFHHHDEPIVERLSSAVFGQLVVRQSSAVFGRSSHHPAIGMARTGRVARDHPYPFDASRDVVGAAGLS